MKMQIAGVSHACDLCVHWLKKAVCAMAFLAFNVLPQGGLSQPPTLKRVVLPPLRPDSPEVIKVCQKLENALDTTLTRELRSLPAMGHARLVEQFVKFRPHADDASWICQEHADGAYSGTQTYLSSLAIDFTQRVLAPIASVAPGHNVKSAFMNLMTQQQSWTVLDVIEGRHEFLASARLAQAMMERESDRQSMDLLALIAARGIWINQGESSPLYQQLIKRASDSSDSMIAANARCWQEAVTDPKTPEGLLLASQVWTMLWVDMSRMLEGSALASRAAKRGQTIYERVERSNKPQAEKERLLGRLAAVISRFAYQTENRAQMKWAVDAANRLTDANPEDRLHPQYVYALQRYAEDNYTEAIKEFEKVFFSAAPCDTAAEAGCQMARCYALKHDQVGALAALEMTAKLYPGQKRITRKVIQLRDSYRKRLGIADGESKTLSAYIERHYKAKLERALARKTRTDFVRELAMHQSR